MTDDSQQSNEPEKDENKTNSLDLSSLQDLSFGPNWSTGSKPRDKKPTGSSGGGKRGGGAGSRDRRPPRPKREIPAGGEGGSVDRPPRREGRPSGGGPRRPGGKGPRGERAAKPAPFKPTMQVLLYPSDAPFDMLVKAIQQNHRTYELFEIANLILQKPERMMIVIKPLEENKGQKFYCALPDNVPYQSEVEAINHVLTHNMTDYFDTEEVEVEPPKGSFPFVQRCTITQKLIGPPNYHLYQQLLKEHHAAHAAHIPIDKYSTTKLEAVREEEQVQEWVQSMTKQLRYKLKQEEGAEGEPLKFESLDAVRHYMATKMKEKVVKETDTVRLPGANMEKLAGGEIRQNIDAILEQQRRFPLDTANNLRGRLRRMRFHIYKKGSKGVSYVCAVKRRFRDPQTKFTDSVQALIDFIEKNANQKPHDVIEQHIGVDKETEKRVTERVAAMADSENKEELSPESEDDKLAREKMAQFMQDLRWLVAEGYVTEFGDGKLFAPPVMETPPHATVAGKAKPAVASAAEAASEASAASEAAPATQEPEEAPAVSEAAPVEEATPETPASEEEPKDA